MNSLLNRDQFLMRNNYLNKVEIWVKKNGKLMAYILKITHKKENINGVENFWDDAE